LLKIRSNEFNCFFYAFVICHCFQFSTKLFTGKSQINPKLAIKTTKTQRHGETQRNLREALCLSAFVVHQKCYIASKLTQQIAVGIFASLTSKSLLYESRSAWIRNGWQSYRNGSCFTPSCYRF